MLKNEFYELDDLTSIVVTYSEAENFDACLYQATVRYITTTKCLTVNTVQSTDENFVRRKASIIVQEMKAEYEQHIRTS